MRAHQAILATALALAFAAAGFAVDEEFNGRIMDVGGRVMGFTASTFTLHVDEYTSPQEAAELARILDEQGSDALLEEIRERDKGYIQVDANLGYPIGAVVSTERPDGGRLIRAITDRPLQMYEVMQGLRSVDYPFGVVEIHMNEDGTGTGQLIAAADIRMGLNGDIIIESLGTEPFRLSNLELETKEESEGEG